MKKMINKVRNMYMKHIFAFDMFCIFLTIVTIVLYYTNQANIINISALVM